MQDFYGAELRLVVSGYIRPEADFTTLDDLRTRILQDAEVTKEALKHPLLERGKDHDFLKPSVAVSTA